MKTMTDNYIVAEVANALFPTLENYKNDPLAKVHRPEELFKKVIASNIGTLINIFKKYFEVDKLQADIKTLIEELAKAATERKQYAHTNKVQAETIGEMRRDKEPRLMVHSFDADALKALEKVGNKTRSFFNA